MNEQLLMIVLRLFHIIAGVAWAGAAMIMAWFVLPSQHALGQTAATFMQELFVRRRLAVYFAVTTGLAILSGITMYLYLAITTHWEWASTTPGIVFGIGGLFALIGAGIGGSAGGRAMRSLIALEEKVRAEGGARTDAHQAELTTILTTMTSKMRIVAPMLLITLIAMACARYL